ncbi:Flagellar assembly protein FliH/Type III secretion system HrpE [Desulfofundulus kuznetsovii DSM 6115]|uniref:Flagellar assembly protein FliH/Type III secretion system HrpE n=1 Tax=Desulfofundulus kuznetsovii (strain DSM 6115 / VKM B-1805 / 17) TaxID=760568 RepID=A0AAU8PDF3_DESK7|nr:Flagellar assembly protein FliH/Type III secretion system HrpE [Desulfofundulus kuznetsovii DSM 6115]
MRSSFRIIRGSVSCDEDPVFIALRYDFPVLPLNRDEHHEGSGNGRGQMVSPDETRAKNEEILAAAQREAAAILEKARHEAEVLARETAARAREEGLQEGWEEGYREGYRKAVEDAAAEARTLREEARQVLQQAEEIRRATLENLEGEVVALAREMAEKIVAAQLTIDPAIVLNIVREALEAARIREQVVIYVNPEQKQLMEERREEILLALPPGTVLNIIGDPAIEPGGCRIETADGRVDATLESRWQALEEVLREAGLQVAGQGRADPS